MDPIRDPEGVETDFLRQTGVLQGRHALEIGCGKGRLSRRLAELTALPVGIDPNIVDVAEAVARQKDIACFGAAFAQAEAENLPFADETFKCAVLGWSL